MRPTDGPAMDCPPPARPPAGRPPAGPRLIKTPYTPSRRTVESRDSLSRLDTRPSSCSRERCAVSPTKFSFVAPCIRHGHSSGVGLAPSTPPGRLWHVKDSLSHHVYIVHDSRIVFFDNLTDGNFVSHAGGSRCVSKLISGVCNFVFVCPSGLN